MPGVHCAVGLFPGSCRDGAAAGEGCGSGLGTAGANGKTNARQEAQIVCCDSTGRHPSRGLEVVARHLEYFAGFDGRRWDSPAKNDGVLERGAE